MNKTQDGISSNNLSDQAERSVQSKQYECDVFLSYNRQDKSKVNKLYEKLKEDGLRVWFDNQNINPGKSIISAIQEGLKNSRVCVLILSCHSIVAKWSEFERNVVISRDPTNKDGRFIPLILDDCEIPEFLNQYSFIDYRKEESAEYGKLLNACKVRGSSISNSSYDNNKCRLSQERSTNILVPDNNFFRSGGSNELRELLSSKIKKFRHERRMSQNYLANELGKSIETLRSFENGSSLPDHQTVEYLAKIFGKELSDFYTRSFVEKIKIDTDKRVQCELNNMEFYSVHSTKEEK